MRSRGSRSPRRSGKSVPSRGSPGAWKGRASPFAAMNAADGDAAAADDGKRLSEDSVLQYTPAPPSPASTMRLDATPSPAEAHRPSDPSEESAFFSADEAEADTPPPPPPVQTEAEAEAEAADEEAEAEVRRLSTSPEALNEATLLRKALGAARAASGGEVEDVAVFDALAPVLEGIAGLNAALKARKVGGTPAAARSRSKRVVRFAAHDLVITPPRAQRAGSEQVQEKVIAQMVPLIKTQRELAATAPAALGRCGRAIAAALRDPAARAGLGHDLAAAAESYAAEAEALAGGAAAAEGEGAAKHAPMLGWRLQELLSSSLRFHLAIIFAEEEGGTDAFLASIREKVREHAASANLESEEVLGCVLSEESFAAVVGAALRVAHTHASMVAEGTETHAALVAAKGDDKGAASALIELPAETKDALLLWAQSHSVLLQTFGPAQQLGRLLKVTGNKYHFGRIAELAAVTLALGMEDEAYFAPLIDLQAFQKRLHEEAALAKAATGKLLVYGLNAKRRSGRERAAKK